MTSKVSGRLYHACAVAAFLIFWQVINLSWWLAALCGLIAWILFFAIDPFTWKKKTPPKFQVGENIAITAPLAQGAGPILEIKWNRREGWFYLVKDTHSSNPKPHWVHEGWIAR